MNWRERLATKAVERLVKTMTEAQEAHVRAAALRCLEMRKANPPVRVDNLEGKRAGDPMYHYCEICGWLAAILHEEHVCPVPKHCFDCMWMIVEGYIELSEE